MSYIVTSTVNESATSMTITILEQQGRRVNPNLWVFETIQQAREACYCRFPLQQLGFVVLEKALAPTGFQFPTVSDLEVRAAAEVAASALSE